MRGLARFLRGNAIALLGVVHRAGRPPFSAATTLAPNSVGTTQLKNGGVTKKKTSKKTIVAPANCPGSLLDPKAARGNLCLYLAYTIGASSTGLNSYGDDGFSDYRFGGVAYVNSTCTAPCFTSFSGTWAVTAP